MSRPERLFRLLNALRVLPKPVTAARLARETEVSDRTLYRDIESLRAGGALIDGAPGLGYTLTEDPPCRPRPLVVSKWRRWSLVSATCASAVMCN